MPDQVDFCAGGLIAIDNSFGSQTQYIPVQGDALSGAEQDDPAIPQSRAGAISQLKILVVAHSRGQTTLTLQKKPSGGSWADTTLSVNFNGTGLFEDTATSPISFSAGDFLVWKVVFGSSSGSTTVSYVSALVEFT